MCASDGCGGLDNGIYQANQNERNNIFLFQATVRNLKLPSSDSSTIKTAWDYLASSKPKNVMIELFKAHIAIDHQTMRQRGRLLCMMKK